MEFAKKVGNQLFQTSDYLAVAYQAIHTLVEGYCWDSWMAACLTSRKLPGPQQYPVIACFVMAYGCIVFLVFICIYAATKENCLCIIHT